jgi:FtsP/CotA-like multicopper oxidase with cupredoxin domain
MRQPEPYVDRAMVGSVFFGPVRVLAGAAFVLGHARHALRDSRRFGPVPVGAPRGGPCSASGRRAAPAPLELPHLPSCGASHDIAIRAFEADMIPRLKTRRWGYNGVAPGPTIVARRGRPAVVRIANQLPARHPDLGYVPATSTHLHGSASLPQYNGYANDLTRPGQYKDYEYPNFQDARTLWYHDHGVHYTAPNVYMGLAGMYVMLDDLEQSLPIPHGRYDVPLVVQDASLNARGQLRHDDNGHSGIYGDMILVNGKPWPVMKVDRRKYRFRILNGSISRSYRFALSTGEPSTFVGTDGGLMPAPQQAASFRHAPAERYEVVIDFSKYRIGQRVILKNLEPPNNTRNGQPPHPWERGPKDVVYLGEEETVRVVARFGPQVGRYMIHCHNLPHEDHDTMGQFSFTGPEGGEGYHPVYADPAQNLPAPPL